MKIVRSYILRECLTPFFLSLVVLTCVFLLGNLIQLTNLVINKGVSLSTIGRVFLLYIPVLLGYTLPLSCLISVALAFSRLSSDNEILALRASGVHLGRLLTPLILLGFIVSLFAIILNERIIPYAHTEQHRLVKSLGAANPTALLEPGMFIKAFNNQIIFIHKIDGSKLSNITIWQPRPDGPTRTIIAKGGEFTPVPGKDQIKLKLINGTSDEPNLNEPNKFYKLNFKTFFMDLDISSNKEKLEKKPKGMTLKELQKEIDNLEKLFVDTSNLRTEYYRKITWSFAALIFVLLSFPISVITNKRERSANAVLVILCAVVYYLLSLGCEALSVKNIFPPAIIMWVPNMVAATGAVILNLKCVS
ncbi:MAG TPA: hypothetical protein DD723_05135 [Candidatus Omnitrophica bacterium]|nr:MAG: hypothetical protein A2Z81_04755 [Omnitrophica WOR_2 bacterium GWA2_45_18]HBR14914.1 hypothetical protein [Candidatus Omnitrophota bacterium]